MDPHNDQSQSSRFNTPSILSQVSQIQRRFASKFKSKSKMVQPLSKWKRLFKSYNISETALFIFCVGSLYVVNPDFVAFQYLASWKACILTTLSSFVTNSLLMRAVRGEIKLQNLFNPSNWNPQEVMSLIVTLLLILFFFSGIIMDQLCNLKRRNAKQKLADLRMGRSKCAKISSQQFEVQKKAFTRQSLNKLLNSDEYKEKFSVVKRVYDERTELSQRTTQDQTQIPESELFKAGYLESTFDRIDEELKKERKQQMMGSQLSGKNGPSQPVSAMLR